jgi:predicted amidophosphoribosyltransferase
VRCAGCGQENRDGRKFCAACGAPLALVCPACGTANEPGPGLDEALALYREIGAKGHARRLAAELAG